MNRTGLCALLLLVALGCGALSAQPQLVYHFNETSGQTAANTGTTGATNNGTFNNAVTWAGGPIGSGSVSVTQNITMTTGNFSPVASSPTDVTVEFWIRTTGTAASGVVGNGNLTIAQIFQVMLYNGGQVGLLCASNAGASFVQLAGTVSVSDGQWHHVAISIAGGIPSLYIDGQADTFNVVGGSGTLPLNILAQNLILFDDSLIAITGFASFAGSMDEFRWWNVARSASEIQQNFSLEWGQTTGEINVRTPANEDVADGASHRVPPREPGSTTTLNWTIQNLHPTAPLSIGTISLGTPQNCTVSITGTNPSGSNIAGGASATLSIQIVAAAGVGNLSFTISIPNDDANENPYDITVLSTRGMTGAFTINNAGGGDYTDIGAAFTDLETYGFADDVTFTVHDSGAGYTANASYELGSNNGTSTPAPVYGVTGAIARFVAATGVRPQISGSFTLNTFTAGFAIANMAITDIRDGTVAIEGFSFSGTTDANIVVFRNAILRGNGGIQILRNHIHTNNAGVGIYAIHNGAALQNLEIENNFFWGHAVTVSAFHTALSIPSNGIVSLFNASDNCRVEHNTIVQNGAAFPAAAAVCLCIKGGAFNLGSMNYNIMQTLADGTKLVDIPTGRQPQNSDRSVFHVGGTGTTFSPLYSDLAAWNATTGLDGASVQGDPLLVSTTDLEIGSGSSPAMDLASGSTTSVDVNDTGRPLGSQPDAGAHEYLNVPAVSVSVPDPDAAEQGLATGEYLVTLSVAPTTDTTVNFTMSGTASTTPGTDYNLSGTGVTFTGPTGTILFPTGVATRTVTLTPIDDALAEGTETAILTVNTGTGYVLGTPTQGTVNIEDNDITEVTMSSSGPAEEQGLVTGTFTLTFTPATLAVTTVNFTLSGTATPGADYSISTAAAGVTLNYTAGATTGSIDVDAGNTTVVVTLTPVDDTLVEGTETATMTINTGAGYVIGTPASADVDIIDNDIDPVASVAVTTGTAVEGGTDGVYQVTLSPTPPSGITLNFTMSGTASTTPGVDYNLSVSTVAGLSITFTGPGGTITVPAGLGSFSVVLDALSDALVEGDETAIFTLNAGTGYTLGATAAGTVTIQDMDIGVSITVPDASAAEATPATETGAYLISLSQASTTALTVNFTMTGTATPTTDYTFSSGTGGVTVNLGAGTVTIPAGTTSASIILTPVDDTEVEAAETAIMTLNAGTGYVVTTPNQGTITIADNDSTGTPVVTVVANGNASEAGPTANTFTITASPVPAGTITVTFTLSGTATIGSDYNASATVSVDIGFGGSATVTITPIDDTLVEGTETVILTLTGGTGYTVGTPGSATMNIIDNDGTGPGPIGGGGGGGGGGGCASGSGTAPWLALIALLGVMALAMRVRASRQ